MHIHKMIDVVIKSHRKNDAFNYLAMQCAELFSVS